jgi:hypothetical protein
MSTLETNSIGKYSGNNVSIDDALNLKSYTTAQRDALTSVAGDMIYNTTDSKVQVHNGSAWENVGANLIEVEYVVVAGGGAGAGAFDAGGGGAGGYISSVSGENSGGGDSAISSLIHTQGLFNVTIGAGGTGASPVGTSGNDSFFLGKSIGGGRGGSYDNSSNPAPAIGGSGGGGTRTASGASGTTGQGYAGGNGASNGGGGGGGASAVGATGVSGTVAAGGAGVSSSITGSSVTYATGGDGRGYFTGGSDASANTGDGGDGGKTLSPYGGGNGGSGIVILRYSSSFTITLGAGLTGTTATVGSNKVTSITAGTGTVSWS